MFAPDVGRKKSGGLAQQYGSAGAAAPNLRAAPICRAQPLEKKWKRALKAYWELEHDNI